MAGKPTGNPNGRPTTYTPELAKRVCAAIATAGCGLKRICDSEPEFPAKSTIYEWIYNIPGFSDQYLEARRLQATVLADCMLDIPDEIPTYEDERGNDRIDAGMLGKAKLDFEIIKWHASKMAPKIYGDAKQVEELASENEKIKQQLQELREQLDSKNQKDY